MKERLWSTGTKLGGVEVLDTEKDYTIRVYDYNGDTVRDKHEPNIVQALTIAAREASAMNALGWQQIAAARMEHRAQEVSRYAAVY